MNLGELRGGRWGMVAAQGLLFAAVGGFALLPAWGPELASSLSAALALVLIGSVGVLWSAANLGSALTPSPVPNQAGLVARGLYRWARHPMYTALVVICLGVAVGSGKSFSYASVIALAVFFEYKTRVEEQHLVVAYEGYAEYAARTGKFVPGIGRRR